MTKRMLIDAVHSEETRVAVVDGTRLIDFDYESQFRKQLKGSIFLAKVTRVEPSLQAAFVNFGGNRHGFLPFSEIHPDYFRIPISDREAILAEQKAEMDARQAKEEADEAEWEKAEKEKAGTDGGDESAEKEEEDESDEIEELGGEDVVSSEETSEEAGAESDSPTLDAKELENKEEKIDNKPRSGRDRGRGGRHNNGRGGRGRAASSRRVEVVGGDGIDGDRPVRPSLRRNYKIQEVVKRGQIMLIQVSREERGNKGAAVTSYLSLPGRYCVLMPNSPRAGGVSRKIANFKERRRMRDILKEFNVPEGMSVIMRTAGVSRTKTEVKRDLDYLMRLWDDIRELTLSSTAPASVHEEGSLVRRSIRDIYGPDIEEVLVAGEEGFKFAKNFMKMMIPSHAKLVKQYEDEKIPLFQRYQVDSQILDMGSPSVTLKSGGYLVINPTEALVSVDVNSGRATKERHIEETALKTNLEAADEVARQLRLRDLGGLVVIDFIDMEDRRNNRKVEQCLKDALSTDRARIQVGRISSFGLLELSRQRLNPSVTEAQFDLCSHCKGVGSVRTTDSAAITALRALEEEGSKSRSTEVVLQVSNVVALYILNNKRDILADIERRYGFSVVIFVNDELAVSEFLVESEKGATSVKADTDKGESKTVSSRDRTTGEESTDDKSDRSGGRRRGRRGGRRRGPKDYNKNDQEQKNEAEGKPQPIPEKEMVEKPPVEDKPKRSNTRSAKPVVKVVDDKKETPVTDKASSKSKKADEMVSKDTKKEVLEDVVKPKKATRKVADKTSKKPKEGDVSAELVAPGKPSNDVISTAREHETVNEAPKKKKKGWWSKAED